MTSARRYNRAMARFALVFTVGFALAAVSGSASADGASGTASYQAQGNQAGSLKQPGPILRFPFFEDCRR